MGFLFLIVASTMGSGFGVALGMIAVLVAPVRVTVGTDVEVPMWSSRSWSVAVPE